MNAFESRASIRCVDVSAQRRISTPMFSYHTQWREQIFDRWSQRFLHDRGVIVRSQDSGCGQQRCRMPRSNRGQFKRHLQCLLEGYKKLEFCLGCGILSTFEPSNHSHGFQKQPKTFKGERLLFTTLHHGPYLIHSKPNSSIHWLHSRLQPMLTGSRLLMFQWLILSTLHHLSGEHKNQFLSIFTNTKAPSHDHGQEFWAPTSPNERDVGKLVRDFQMAHKRCMTLLFQTQQVLADERRAEAERLEGVQEQLEQAERVMAQIAFDREQHSKGAPRSGSRSIKRETQGW